MRNGKWKVNVLITIIKGILVYILISTVYFEIAKRTNPTMVRWGFSSDTQPQTIELYTSPESLVETVKFFNKEVARISVGDQVNTKVVGEYQVKYYFLENIFTKTYNVVDIEPPTIDLTGDSVVTVKNILEYKEPGFEAFDNYDGDLTKQVTTKLVMYGENNYCMEYSVTDSSGNTGTAVRRINVEIQVQQQDKLML